MSKNNAIWLRGLITAIVTGFAHSVTAAFSANLVDSQHFNTGAGLVPILKLAGACGVTGCIISTVTYLQKSPIPDWDGEVDRRTINPPQDGGK